VELKLAVQAPAPAEPVRAAPIALDPAMTVEAVLQVIGRVCLADLLRNEAAALGGDPEGVHQMRVASRRIRSSLSAFKKTLPAAERRWASDELDRLDEILGPARNLDVFASDLLAPRRAALPGEPALDRLATPVNAARQAAYARVRELILSPLYTESVLQLRRWFEARGWRGGEAPAPRDPLSAAIGDVAPRLLDRRLRTVRKRGKGFRGATAKERHKLRIAVKELRYTSELLGSLFDPQDVRSFGKPLRTLQDGLGYANDVRVGHDVVNELSAQAADKEAIMVAGARVLGWHEHAVREGERTVRKHLRLLKWAAPFWKPLLPP
jgi:CHAD domain-containing protein